jgi:hypothetical protein
MLTFKQLRKNQDQMNHYFKLMGLVYQLQHFNFIEEEALVVKAKAKNCYLLAILLVSINLELNNVFVMKN